MSKQAKTHELVIGRPRGPAEFKALGGSDVDEFNQALVNQALSSLWTAHSDDDHRNRQYLAATATLSGAKPQSELEGMLLAQMIACHSAAMECYRRAMVSERSFEVWQVQVGAAGKLSRTYATLLEALGRHRGQGRQVIRIERVTVEAGGQAIVGAVNQGGGGGYQENEDRAHAPGSIAHEPEPALRCPDAQREAMPVPGGERTEALPDARRSRRQRRTDR